MKKQTTPQPMRPLSEIAIEIRNDMVAQHGGKWRMKFVYAVEQLDAISTLNSIRDDYYADRGTQVVASFLCNATTWKGETARRIKKELNDQLKQARS